MYPMFASCIFGGSSIIPKIESYTISVFGIMGKPFELTKGFQYRMDLQSGRDSSKYKGLDLNINDSNTSQYLVFTSKVVII